MSKAENIVKNLTHVDIERFTHDDKNVAVLASVSAENPKAVTLYRPNLRNGGVGVYKINVHLAHANSVQLAKEVANYFYTLVDAEISALASEVGDLHPNDLTDEDRVKYDVLMRRIADAHAIVEAGKVSGTTPGRIATIIAQNRFGVKLESYGADVQAAITPVVDELKRLYAIAPEDGSLPNVSALRDLITTLGRTIWGTTDLTGNVDGYTFNCNHALARDVYTVYYKGRVYDKDGNIARRKADGRTIADEIIRAIIEQMQKKRERQDAEQATSAQPTGNADVQNTNNQTTAA